ncbi:hypothetical protein [uncultured Actinomyces sp.]|uniref:hypothetical protein n=1 Tax=uncultured Actinomyces sp. TaxID=249061 RepID=UPI0028DC4261|nr:hypothetical protein [uncultured Actinomyces sp.]
MTLTRRNAILSAAALTGLPLLLPSQARAQEVGAGATDVNLEEWTLIDSLSDNFDTPLDPSRWHKGLWYPTSGVGAFRDENAEASDGVLHLWARAEHHEGRDHTFGAVESVFDTPGVCSYVEVRARALPSAAHVLSAVWLQSSNLDGQNALAADPNPEIDVQETFDFHAMTSATHICRAIPRPTTGPSAGTPTPAPRTSPRTTTSTASSAGRGRYSSTGTATWPGACPPPTPPCGACPGTWSSAWRGTWAAPTTPPRRPPSTSTTSTPTTAPPPRCSPTATSASSTRRAGP